MSNWKSIKLIDLCKVEYGTRVVRKRDAGTIFPVYGGGGATFSMDVYNRENRMIIARFAMSEKCTRFVNGKFFLNDSGLTISAKDKKLIDEHFLNYQMLSLNDKIYSLARGTAQKNLNVDEFKNLTLSLPNSIAEQKEIVEILDQAFESIEKAKANIERNIENAKELFQSKLNQIFSQNGEGWEEKTFEDVSSRIGDGLHGTPKYNPDGEYYFINGNNLENGKIVFKKNTKRVDESEFIKHKRNLTENTVLVSINGTLGKVAFYNNEKIVLGKSACYINFNNQVNKKFIKYLIKSPIFFKNMTKESTGATIKNFSLKSMRNYKFNLPPKIQQKEIVESLDIIDNHIESVLLVYKEELKNLEELKKSILQKAFSGELTNKNKAA